MTDRGVRIVSADYVVIRHKGKTGELRAELRNHKLYSYKSCKKVPQPLSRYGIPMKMLITPEVVIGDLHAKNQWLLEYDNGTIIVLPLSVSRLFQLYLEHKFESRIDIQKLRNAHRCAKRARKTARQKVTALEEKPL